MRISIIICTRDRADHLRETMRSLAGVTVPRDVSCELLIIDNASRDHTPSVVAETKMPMVVQLFHEPLPGQSRARNLGLVRAGGDIVLFTDDDLRFPTRWLEAMTAPLICNDAQGVAGSVRLAPHLHRAWMKPVHRYWLAENAPEPGPIYHMIGASMGFRREVLEKVPLFDEELGPGTLGFGDDSLFSYQLTQAGYSLHAVTEPVEHHLLPSRLTRANFLNHAKNLGKSGAYHDYHWEHAAIRLPRLRLLKKWLDLAVWRRAHPEALAQSEGMDEAEMMHLRSFHLFGQYLIERRRPRNYTWHGLVKLSAG